MRRPWAPEDEREAERRVIRAAIKYDAWLTKEYEPDGTLFETPEDRCFRNAVKHLRVVRRRK